MIWLEAKIARMDSNEAILAFHSTPASPQHVTAEFVRHKTNRAYLLECEFKNSLVCAHPSFGLNFYGNAPEDSLLKLFHSLFTPELLRTIRSTRDISYSPSPLSWVISTARKSSGKMPIESQANLIHDLFGCSERQAAEGSPLGFFDTVPAPHIGAAPGAVGGLGGQKASRMACPFGGMHRMFSGIVILVGCLLTAGIRSPTCVGGTSLMVVLHFISLFSAYLGPNFIVSFCFVTPESFIVSRFMLVELIEYIEYLGLPSKYILLQFQAYYLINRVAFGVAQW